MRQKKKGGPKKDIDISERGGYNKLKDKESQSLK